MKPIESFKKLEKGQKALVIIFIVAVVAVIADPKDEIKKEKEPDIPLTQHQIDSAYKAELIKKSFSAWDGSHINLVTLLKNNLNDAKSFEHIDTRYREISDSTLFVSMDYRAANMFGGLVKKRISAIVSLDGQILKVEE